MPRKYRHISDYEKEMGIADINIIIEKNNAKDFLIVFICIPPNFI